MFSFYRLFNCGPWKRAPPFFYALKQCLLNTYYVSSTGNEEANMKFLLSRSLSSRQVSSTVGCNLLEDPKIFSGCCYQPYA